MRQLGLTFQAETQRPLKFRAALFSTLDLGSPILNTASRTRPIFVRANAAVLHSPLVPMPKAVACNARRSSSVYRVPKLRIRGAKW